MTSESPATPPLPPQPPVDNKESSFHHKAARFAVLALAFSFVINLMAKGSLSADNAAVYRIISLICGLFFLAAIPAGIIALAGIPKYGRRYLLWRGLVGALLPILLLAIAIPALLKVRSAAEHVRIQALLHVLNKDTPKMLDEMTRLENAKLGPGKILTVTVTITAYTADQIDRDVWDRDVVPTLKQGILESRLVEAIKADYTVTQRYNGSDGVLIDELTLTKADLPAQ